MKKIYLVKLRDGATSDLPGYRGDGEYLIDCYAHEEKNGRHCFVHGYSSDSVPSDRVVSVRELSHKEAMGLMSGTDSPVTHVGDTMDVPGEPNDVVAYHPDPEINARMAKDMLDAENDDLEHGYKPRRWACPKCGRNHGRGHHGSIGTHRCLHCGYIGTGGVMYDETEGVPVAGVQCEAPGPSSRSKALGLTAAIRRAVAIFNGCDGEDSAGTFNLASLSKAIEEQIGFGVDGRLCRLMLVDRDDVECLPHGDAHWQLKVPTHREPCTPLGGGLNTQAVLDRLSKHVSSPTGHLLGLDPFQAACVAALVEGQKKLLDRCMSSFERLRAEFHRPSMESSAATVKAVIHIAGVREGEMERAREERDEARDEAQRRQLLLDQARAELARIQQVACRASGTTRAIENLRRGSSAMEEGDAELVEKELDRLYGVNENERSKLKEQKAFGLRCRGALGQIAQFLPLTFCGPEEISKVTIEHLRELRAKLDMVKTRAENVWYWQGEGDRPESLTCPVVMSADTLRELIKPRSKREEVETTCAATPAPVGDERLAWQLDAAFVEVWGGDRVRSAYIPEYADDDGKALARSFLRRARALLAQPVECEPLTEAEINGVLRESDVPGGSWRSAATLAAERQRAKCRPVDTIIKCAAPPALDDSSLKARLSAVFKAAKAHYLSDDQDGDVESSRADFVHQLAALLTNHVQPEAVLAAMLKPI